MRPHRVVVLDVLTKQPPPMPFVDGDDVIAALAPERPDHPLGDGVGVRRAQRSQNRLDPDPSSACDEVPAIATVAVSDEEPWLLTPGGRLDHLPPDPGRDRVLRDVPVPDAAPAVVDHDEHVERAEGEGLHREQVSSPDAGRVVAQKRAPRLTRRSRQAWTDEALTEQVRAVLAASPFTGEGYRKVWARLRLAGVRTSKGRVLRLMREAGLLAPTRVGRRRGPRVHDGTITTERPDEMWGTDATSCLTTREGNATVFIAVDHCTQECIGIHAARPGTRFEALEPLRQGLREHFDGYEADLARGLALRHDHGSQYLSDHFQEELRFLGIRSSPSFVAAPEGNGCAERFIRTLKEQLLWVEHRASPGCCAGASRCTHPRLLRHSAADVTGCS